ncbi:MAG: hypothetical protein H8D45_14580, partial [Bacteroidetes bacterium]|nr:hypothetical protein [Bacteroidota bacterium]
MSIPDLIMNANENLILKSLAFQDAQKFVLSASCYALECVKRIYNKKDVSKQDIDLVKSYKELNNNLKKHNIKSEDYYHSLLFIDLISSTEIHFVELIKIILVN